MVWRLRNKFKRGGASDYIVKDSRLFENLALMIVKKVEQPITSGQKIVSKRLQQTFWNCSTQETHTFSLHHTVIEGGQIVCRRTLGFSGVAH